MKNSENIVCGMFLFGLLALGYSAYITRKMDRVCSKLDTSVDEISESVNVDLSEVIVKDALDQAMDKAAYKAVKNAAATAVKQIHNDIFKEVKIAVNNAYTDLKEDIAIEMHRQVSNIDISSIKQTVIEKASKRVAEKFESDLEDILEKYNKDLNNVSKIYSSIAKSVFNCNVGKEMAFRIG